MSQYKTMRRLLKEHPEMSTADLALLTGWSRQKVAVIRWRVKNWVQYLEKQRLADSRRRRAKGVRPVVELRSPKREAIAALRAAGLTYGEISSRVGTTRSAVAGIVHRMGV